MKLSNVLLTAMLASAYGSLAQESIAKPDLDSLYISNNNKKSVEVTIDSVLLKKIDSLYENRNNLRLDKQKTNSEYANAKKPKLNQQKATRPYYFNCPGCGRG